MTPDIGPDGTVRSPCGTLRFFFDDYDPQPTFYSSVNAGLEISDQHGNVLADFAQASWDASYALAFPAKGIAHVRISHANGTRFLLVLDTEHDRFALAMAKQGSTPALPAELSWQAGLGGMERALYAAAIAI